MRDQPIRDKSYSTILESSLEGDRIEIANTIRWVGFSALGIFTAMLLFNLLVGKYWNSLVIAIGILPIVVSLFLIRLGSLSAPSIILSTTITLLITALAMSGQGIYDVGVMGYPVILIVAGLIMRGRVITVLAIIEILCMAWLVFGDIWNLYEPEYLAYTQAEDFFIGAIIVVIGGNAVYRLARNAYENLTRAKLEIRMREEAEEKRQVLIQQLTRKNQELDRFAIRVSHDLKTPLITVAGFLGYLEKDLNSMDVVKAKKDFAQISDAAKKMGIFIDELLDLSRAGRIINPPKNVSFEDIVQDALRLTDGILRAKQVQVEVETSFPTVHVDHPRIVQVMQNLITNSVKFMGDQPLPKIKFGNEEKNGENIFYVSDNGMGIPLEHHERIFELFNKLHPEIEGTGIGLGLVKKIIEVHNGRIWVESEPGKGTTVKFTLDTLPVAVHG